MLKQTDCVWCGCKNGCKGNFIKIPLHPALQKELRCNTPSNFETPVSRVSTPAHPFLFVPHNSVPEHLSKGVPSNMPRPRRLAAVTARRSLQSTTTARALPPASTLPGQVSKFPRRGSHAQLRCAGACAPTPPGCPNSFRATGWRGRCLGVAGAPVGIV